MSKSANAANEQRIHAMRAAVLKGIEAEDITGLRAIADMLHRERRLDESTWQKVKLLKRKAKLESRQAETSVLIFEHLLAFWLLDPRAAEQEMYNLGYRPPTQKEIDDWYITNHPDLGLAARANYFTSGLRLAVLAGNISEADLAT